MRPCRSRGGGARLTGRVAPDFANVPWCWSGLMMGEVADDGAVRGEMKGH